MAAWDDQRRPGPDPGLGIAVLWGFILLALLAAGGFGVAVLVHIIGELPL